MPTFSQIFSGLCRLDSLFLPTTRILGKSYVVCYLAKKLKYKLQTQNFIIFVEVLHIEVCL